MIDVPVRVKDALRDGRLRKNYTFKVYKLTKGYLFAQTLSNNTSYTINDTRPIRIQSEQSFTAVISTPPTKTEIPAALGTDNIYRVEIGNPTPSYILGVKDLPSNDDTVDMYLWSEDGEWLLFDTLDNNSLVKESVKVDERMCSGNQLKFGLCEGSSLEFQYFNHQNINGMRIEASVDVQYEDEFGDMAWHTIPMGWYTVVQCPMQFSTGIYKVTAYNKLRSDYLDQKANEYLAEAFSGRSSIYFYELRKALTDEYEIDTSEPLTMKGSIITVAQISNTGYSISNTAWETTPFWTGTGCKPYMASVKSSITLDPDKMYLFHWNHGSADDFEDRVYNDSLSPILTDAVGNSNAAAILSAMLGTYTTGGYSGCYTFFGAILTKRDGSTEIYSKRAYENNKYSAVGPLSNILDRYLHDCTKLEFYMPIAFALEPDSSKIELYSTLMTTNIKMADGTIVQATSNYWGISQIDSANKDYGIFSLYDARDSHTHKNLGLKGYAWVCNSNWVWPTYRFTNIAFLWNYSLTSREQPGVLGELPYFFNLLFTDGASTSDKNSQPAYDTLTTPYSPIKSAHPVDINDIISVRVSNVENSADLILVDPNDLSDITARDAVSAVYELSACYGRLDRETDFFAPIELNGSRLLPSDTLYPANDLYPNGNSARANKSMYQKLWTDSQGNQKFRYLYITYKGLDANNQEVEKVLQRTVNADGTTDYNMSDNWLFKNLVWSDADVGDYADAMVLKMKDISWFPFEMWCAGLPYIETGDELEITNSEGTYTSYVLQRQLNGIQNLQDTFIDGELDIF